MKTMTVRRYRVTQALAVLALVASLAIPAFAVSRNEAPGGVRHTIELHGRYEGCKWTGGWAQRVWKHTGTGPGPERDPNYPGQWMWDFRCKRPVTETVTVTVTAPAPPSGTVTVTTTPTPTVTQTPSPSCEPSVRWNDDDCDD
jgi:uncharacterized protein YjdB